MGQGIELGQVQQKPSLGPDHNSVAVGGSAETVHVVMKRRFLERMFAGPMSDFILNQRNRLIIFVVFLIWIIPMVIVASRAEASTTPDQFLPSDHPFQRIFDVLYVLWLARGKFAALTCLRPCFVSQDQGVRCHPLLHVLCVIVLTAFCQQVPILQRRHQHRGVLCMGCQGCRPQWSYHASRSERVRQGGVERRVPFHQRHTEPCHSGL